MNCSQNANGNNGSSNNGYELTMDGFHTSFHNDRPTNNYHAHSLAPAAHNFPNSQLHLKFEDVSSVSFCIGKEYFGYKKCRNGFPIFRRIVKMMIFAVALGRAPPVGMAVISTAKSMCPMFWPPVLGLLMGSTFQDITTAPPSVYCGLVKLAKRKLSRWIAENRRRCGNAGG